MRNITVKYEGNCRKCNTTLQIGSLAIYERHIGLFCPPCAPTDAEEIRQYRQEAGDRRADKYTEWAQKRKNDANVILNHNKVYTEDIAFNTQPGHIPLRARVIKQNDRANESLAIAQKFEDKADSLRKVRVAGDAKQKRQAVREHILSIIKVGMLVETGIYGQGIVKKINKKTATIGSAGISRSYIVNVDLSFIRPI